jgi:hypothetical protein
MTFLSPREQKQQGFHKNFSVVSPQVLFVYDHDTEVKSGVLFSIFLANVWIRTQNAATTVGQAFSFPNHSYSFQRHPFAFLVTH